MNRFSVTAILILTTQAYALGQPPSWGAWSKLSCWPGINYRFGADAGWNGWDPNASQHMIWVQFYNQYTVPISFNSRIVSPAEVPLYDNGTKHTTDRVVTLPPGTYTSDWDFVATPSPTATVCLKVHVLPIGGCPGGRSMGAGRCNYCHQKGQ